MKPAPRGGGAREPRGDPAAGGGARDPRGDPAAGNDVGPSRGSGQHAHTAGGRVL